MARMSSRPVGGHTFAGVRAWAASGIARMDPLAFLVASWWLALVAIAVLQQAHAGLHERHEVAPVLHILRDGALAVPAAAAAVLIATLVVEARTREAGIRGLRPWGVDRVAWVVLGAAIFAIFSIPGHQLHGALFGAEEEELGWLADIALDFGIAFAGALLALGPLAAVAGPPVLHVHGATNPAPEPARLDRSGTIAAPRTGH